MKTFCLLLAITMASALPMQRTVDAPAPAPAPVVSGCSFHNTSDICNDDTCCNWCAPTINATAGFCMPTIPTVPSTALTCAKTIGDCKANIDVTSCGSDATCKWAPFGPPGTPVGMCVYDWDRCKPTPAPASTFKKAAKARIEAKAIATKEVAPPGPIPPGPTPKPKVNCTMITEAACNGETCCEWCGNVFSPIGWCMPITGKPVPSLTCSKSPEGCEAIKVEATCESYDLCAWLPIGPPGSGMGYVSSSLLPIVSLRVSYCTPSACSRWSCTMKDFAWRVG